MSLADRGLDATTPAAAEGELSQEQTGRGQRQRKARGQTTHNDEEAALAFDRGDLALRARASWSEAAALARRAAGRERATRKDNSRRGSARWEATPRSGRR
jgi:hypothetical protein